MPSSSDFIVPFPGPGPEPVTFDGWYPSSDPDTLTYFYWSNGFVWQGVSVERKNLQAFINARNEEEQS